MRIEFKAVPVADFNALCECNKASSLSKKKLMLI